MLINAEIGMDMCGGHGYIFRPFAALVDYFRCLLVISFLYTISSLVSFYATAALA